MQPLKLVVIGPVKSGKTTISNFLADATEIPYDYHPTRGVRILEFEVENIELHNERITKDIELWDCSGDHKFQNCWPAVRKDLHGVILVYSAESENECVKQLQEFYDYFIIQTKLGPDSCVIFCFDPDNIMPDISKIVSSTFAKVSHVRCNVEDGGDKLKSDFRSFLSTHITKMRDSAYQEEKSLMNDNILFVK